MPLILSSPVPLFPSSFSFSSNTRTQARRHAQRPINQHISKPQHYELIPQTTLQTAEASLRAELAPAITTLLDRADAHIARVDRRVESLKARAELQQGRLDDAPSSSSSSRSRNNNNNNNSAGTATLDPAARLRARVMKQRREALQYSVERLELEVLQKERELRKRLDAA